MCCHKYRACLYYAVPQSHSLNPVSLVQDARRRRPQLRLQTAALLAVLRLVLTFVAGVRAVVVGPPLLLSLLVTVRLR